MKPPKRWCGRCRHWGALYYELSDGSMRNSPWGVCGRAPLERPRGLGDCCEKWQRKVVGKLRGEAKDGHTENQ